MEDGIDWFIISYNFSKLYLNKIYIEPIYSIFQLKLLQKHNLNNIFPLFPSIVASLYLDQPPLRFNHMHLLSIMWFDYVYVFTQYFTNGFECFIIQTNRDKCRCVIGPYNVVGILIFIWNQTYTYSNTVNVTPH